MGSSLFHKALKEAFEAFCNKQVAGCTIAEIMANFCNNLLKRVSPSCRHDQQPMSCLSTICVAAQHPVPGFWSLSRATLADRMVVLWWRPQTAAP